LITLPETFNVATHFVDRNVQEGRGAKVAIECGDECVTYQQLLQKTNCVGNALLGLGVRPEERVLLLLLDTPEFLYSFFGAIKIGAVAVPVNTQGKPQDYEYILNDCRARIALVSGPLLPHLQSIPREKLRYLREIVVSEVKQTIPSEAQPSHSHHSLQNLIASASPELEAALTSKDEPAFWLYSSGSTGASKGCVHLHHDMVVCCELYAKGILQMKESDRCFSVRLFFAHGPETSVTSSLLLIQQFSRPYAPRQPRFRRHRTPGRLCSSVPRCAALVSPRSGTEFDLSACAMPSPRAVLPAPLFQRFKTLAWF
jgi:benzoate-CoA ligase